MNNTGYTKEFWEKIGCIVDESEIVIDRPKGSHHPRYPSIVYPLDYGYLKGTSSMDGGGIDVWRGTDESQKVRGIILTVDTTKKDSEIKILIGCNNEETEIVYLFHNEHESMRGLLITR